MSLEKKTTNYFAIGVMSGSSLDGLDVCYVRFSKNANWSFEILHSKVYAIKEWKIRLQNARNVSQEKLNHLDESFGKFIGEKVNEFIEELPISTLDIVSSHGHTIYHFPEKGITKQIGRGEQIFNKTQFPTLTNLRQKDIDLGGNGAPIVPIGDLHLFSEYKYCLNIGGIANVSKKRPNSEIVAFDICSANQVLNHFAGQRDKEYDDNGDLARKGKLNKQLWKKLNLLDYYQVNPPKSLDNLFTKKVLSSFDGFDISIEDKLHTYCDHIAYQISNTVSLEKMQEKMLITGGGAFNSFLMQNISKYLLPKNVEVVIPSKQIIENKESLIMAFMGVLHLRNEVNCLSSATGASKDCIGGELTN